MLSLIRATKYNILFGLVFVLFLGLAYLVYMPGLSGAFLFDDFPNLKSLGVSGGINDWESLKRYLLSGFSGPTGRPISLASFLIDARSWPADPAQFKNTNIILHLINGILLFFFLFLLLKVVEPNKAKRDQLKIVSGFCSLAWLLHPFLVSTTLYVVQRMAMLPLTFSLIALILWVHLRTSVDVPTGSTYFKLTAVLGLFTLLATFSKENGALLPVFILVIEFSVLSGRAFSLNPLWKFIFLVLPLVFIILYLFYLAFRVGWTTPYKGREFSPGDRVLTQFRIVLEYLMQWFVPKINTTGIYHDTIQVSRGLFSPVSTFFCLLGVLVLIVLAILKRWKWPLFSASVLFFFASQLIESTTIGLELKFEHRVYLGSIMLFLPLATLIVDKLKTKKVIVLFVAVLFGLASFTYMRSQLWGDYPTMVMVWAEKLPESSRAQIELGKLLFEAGREEDALEVLASASERIPDSWPLRLTALMVKCRLMSVSEAEKNDLLALASTSLYRPASFNLMQNLLGWVEDPECRGLDDEFVVRFVNSFLAYPRNNMVTGLPFSQLTYIKGIALLRKNDMLAFDVLRQSIEVRSEPQKLMNIAGHMATQGYIGEARDLALKARKSVVEDDLYGKSLAEAPELSDIDDFLAALNYSSVGPD